MLCRVRRKVFHLTGKLLIYDGLCDRRPNALPLNNRFRLYDKKSGFPIIPKLGKYIPEEAILVPKFDALDTSLLDY